MLDGIVKKRAIILNGSIEPKYAMEAAAAAEVYKKQGYEVFVVAPERPKGEVDRYVLPYQGHVLSLIGELTQISDSDDELVIVTTGHGGKPDKSEAYCLADGCDTNTILDYIDGIPYGNRFFITASCYGANWVDRFLDDPKTTFISASGRNEMSWSIDDKSFLLFFFNAAVPDYNKDGRVSPLERYSFAASSGGFFLSQYLTTSDIALEEGIPVSPISMREKTAQEKKDLARLFVTLNDPSAQAAGALSYIMLLDELGAADVVQGVHNFYILGNSNDIPVMTSAAWALGSFIGRLPEEEFNREVMKIISYLKSEDISLQLRAILALNGIAMQRGLPSDILKSALHTLCALAACEGNKTADGLRQMAIDTIQKITEKSELDPDDAACVLASARKAISSKSDSLYKPALLTYVLLAQKHLISSDALIEELMIISGILAPRLLFDHRNPEVRQAALWAYSSLLDDTYLDRNNILDDAKKLREMFEDENASVRYAALMAYAMLITRYGPQTFEGEREALTRLILDGNNSSRYLALCAYSLFLGQPPGEGNMSDSALLQDVFKMDGDPVSQYTAMHQYPTLAGKVGASEIRNVVENLDAALSGDSYFIRYPALATLSAIADTGALTPEAAAKSLKRIRSFIQNKRYAVKLQALQTYLSFARNGLVPDAEVEDDAKAMRSLLKDASPETRRAAAVAYCELARRKTFSKEEVTEGVGALLDALKTEEDGKTRDIVFKILSEVFGSPDKKVVSGEEEPETTH